jgi:plastocyanin
MRQRIALLFALALLTTPILVQAAYHNVSVGPGNSFSPQTVNISAGDRVIWTLLGGTHNVNSDTGLFGNVLSSSWSTHTVTFGGAGTFGYHCEAHGSPGSGMFGTVVVTGGGATPARCSSAPPALRSMRTPGRRSSPSRAGGDNGRCR